MERFLATVGFPDTPAEELGDDTREIGRVALQHPSLPALRLAEVGSDLILLTREDGGPAWPGLQTRWRTEFHLEKLWPMPGGNLTGSGLWEPVPGESVPVSVHINTLSDGAPNLTQPRTYAAYLGLLAGEVRVGAAPTPRLTGRTGPTTSPEAQCRLTVRGRVSHAYEMVNDVTGRPVMQLWLTGPGSWALLVAAAPEAVRGQPEPGAWVEATGLLQGDLVVSAF